ncbi:Putative plasmid stability protein y4jK [Gluconacetobacter sp. SXCC-1]|uniref:Ribonuclease VapC n=1 Tax=Komagataeibacter rhaeticus TaxID=215221 RepID=A0A7H4IM06_9PROT|nr:type II toxin-antitoxin system VapC family toxin [Komagataeibacter rhaeticus]EGG79033.1 Putative plasmid stability protein y4jK [Gluconacetobacter sp. SXCC-1]QIP34424.1 type II toxin-antitoxin system VapC family toxin [Komagataeibacter rhaeticus]QIP37222.1 type II toxin-antitoxin system VapC family toxin [Komagataeibacter rhaeticus]QOC46940.1 type II toxin-antitoxin system VapC family toxin [Komagataeibacter rhaeticus]QOC48358.1 type II toxin-antitoxin system VapC family toxin [Komagataeiba
MILLDTNVISEPWKPVPEQRVLAWIDGQAIETLFLSAVTVAELRFGIGAMPSGRRRSVLHERLEQEVLPLFAGRVLSFDLAASQAYAELMVRARSEGRAIGKADGYIAATAASRGYVVASRDVSPFEAAGVRVLNPWEDT